MIFIGLCTSFKLYPVA